MFLLSGMGPGFAALLAWEVAKKIKQQVEQTGKH